MKKRRPCELGARALIVPKSLCRKGSLGVPSFGVQGGFQMTATVPGDPATTIVSVEGQIFDVPLAEVLTDAKHGDHTHFELVTATVRLAD